MAEIEIMLFNSYTFFIFLFFILISYYGIINWTWRKFILLLGSYVFYSAWNPPFVILLWLSTIVDWIVSKQIYSSQTKKQSKYWLLLSLVTNLGLLAFFKYGNFLIENINWLYSDELLIDQYEIILPVGISFYTFQTLSYSLDIYRGNSKPWHSFLDYALYVTFFPQLVAGPIVRSDQFLSQCNSPVKFNLDNLGYGFFWLVVGLFLKVVVADHFLAPFTETAYTADVILSPVSAWLGTLAFSGQILCDFSGYSICAIGIAQMLGFYLPKNFRFPYASAGFSEFWRRWHISLSTWLRDYVYIPLGGNRNGNFKTYQNLMFTMLIGGLWHGASWTFVVWGGLHGLYLGIERSLKKSIDFSKLPLPFRVVGVFILVCFTWVFFRAGTFNQAYQIILSMLWLQEGENLFSLQESLTVSFVMALLIAVNYTFRNMDLSKTIQNLKWWKISFLISLFLYLIFTLAGEDRSFIYFQF